MDDESRIAVRLLEAIALVNEECIKLAQGLRRRPEATEVHREWEVSARVEAYTEKGHDTVKEFPEKTTGVFSEFLDQLKQSAAELIASADAIDLSMI